MSDRENDVVKPPGVEGIWVFIIGDLIIFLLYFLVFAMGRINNTELFELGRQQLEPLLAFINTLILLSSSYFVVLAVEGCRKKDAKAVKRFLILAIILGTAFVVIKLVGYSIDLTHFSLRSNVFFAYYFAITGIHCAHVIIGTILLGVCLFKSFKNLKKTYLRFLESCALFWHMVDLLWVIIFPMFYLMGGIA